MPYDNTNRGSIWRNERKETDNHPDFTGTQNVVCPHCKIATDFWVSAWRRKEGASEKAPPLSFSVKPREALRPPVRPSSAEIGRDQGAAPRKQREDMDDIIPFLMEWR